MSSHTRIGPYVIQLDGGQAPAVLDTQTGYQVSMAGATHLAQFLEQVAQEVTRLRGGSVPAGQDVWEQLRCLTISEAQLNAALLQIQQILGCPGPMMLSSHDTVEKVRQMYDISTLKGAQAELAQRDQKIKDLESHLRDYDVACEQGQMIAKLELQVKTLQRYITDAFRNLGCVIEPPPEQLPRYVELARNRNANDTRILEIDHLTRERDQLKKEVETTKGFAYVSDYLIKIKDLESHLRDRDEACENWAKEARELKAQALHMEGLVRATGSLQADLQGARGERDVLIARVKELETERDVKERDALKAKLTSTPALPTQTRAGEIDEALRKSHPGLEASMSDIREMIIEALKVAKVIS